MHLVILDSREIRPSIALSGHFTLVEHLMKIPKLRWVIAAMLFLATMINYLDRTALSVVSVDVRREFRSERAGLLAHS